nr:FMN-binding negative transcriptional regulator [Bacteroidota bacterium]
HASGTVKLLEGDERSVEVLEKMISTYEQEFYKQWKSLSPDYVNGMLKAIVSFEIEVTKLEGKFKLSQNKTKNEQQNIIRSFEHGPNSAAAGIADEMKKKI